MRISQPNYEKGVGKGHLLERVYLLSRNAREKGNPAGAPSAPGARGFAHPEPIGVTPLSRKP